MTVGKKFQKVPFREFDLIIGIESAEEARAFRAVFDNELNRHILSQENAQRIIDILDYIDSHVVAVGTI